METEKHAFRIRTVKASPFRILIEALKEILTEANLEIDPNGLKIIAMDGTQTVLVHLRLHSEWFEEFYCPQRLILGLNMINFFKLIKTVSNNESLILSMEKEDTTRLSITTLNGENQKTTKYHLNLIELDIHPIEIPPVAFQTTITMPSTDFQKVIRDMFSLAETVEVRSAANELVFKCRGDFAEQERFFMLETR
jgi:proliferating cell nuclear antigen